MVITHLPSYLFHSRINIKCYKIYCSTTAALLTTVIADLCELIWSSLLLSYIHVRRILTAVPPSDWKSPPGRRHTSWLATMKNNLLFFIPYHSSIIPQPQCGRCHWAGTGQTDHSGGYRWCLHLMNDVKATWPISCLLEVALYAKGTEPLCSQPLP